MNLVVGQKYSVKVQKILKVGAIVKLEDGSTELIHISNISPKFVDDVNNFVEVGSTYEAICQEGKIKPIELSLKPLELRSKAAPHPRVKISEPKDTTPKEFYDNNSKDESRPNLDYMIDMFNQDCSERNRSSRKRDNKNFKKKRRDRFED